MEKDSDWLRIHCLNFGILDSSFLPRKQEAVNGISSSWFSFECREIQNFNVRNKNHLIIFWDASGVLFMEFD
ncbi:hypothetical protein TNCV_2902921 [Trichonephila clavipes]|nr:hypothetical protein TNCV_2902921 [Trichonephila clavipes]